VPTVRRQSQQNQTRHWFAMAYGKLSEVFVLCDQNAAFGAAPRHDRLVSGAGFGFEHVVDVVPGGAKRGNQARVAALVEQQPHGSASTTASSAR
jgi:hypothetical protein